MPCMKAITVILSSLFATAMTDTLLPVAPLLQTTIDVVCIRVHTRAWGNCGVDERCDGDLLDVCQHPHHHRSTALDHPEDRRLFGVERAPSPRAPAPSAPSVAPCFATASGLPVWPATMETSSHSPSALQGGVGFLATMPWRN